MLFHTVSLGQTTIMSIRIDGYFERTKININYNLVFCPAGKQQERKHESQGAELLRHNQSLPDTEQPTSLDQRKRSVFHNSSGPQVRSPMQDALQGQERSLLRVPRGQSPPPLQGIELEKNENHFIWGGGLCSKGKTRDCPIICLLIVLGDILTTWHLVKCKKRAIVRNTFIYLSIIFLNREKEYFRLFPSA